MIDLVLLQTIKRRNDFEEYRPMIKDHLVDENTKKLIYDFEAYFKTNPAHEEIDWDLFPTYFKQVRHPNIKSDDLTFFNTLFERVRKEPKEESKKSLKTQLLDNHLATVVVNKGHDMLDGKMTGDKFIDNLEEEIDKTKEKKNQYADVLWDNSSIIEVANNLSYDNGLKFGLGCLDDSCGSLHPSNFIIVGAFVDTGKTTFIADQFVACMLKQIVDVENKDKWFYQRPILWFNNEGSSASIKLYCVQSFFGSPYERIVANPQGAEEAFIKEIGDPNLLRIIQCQGWHIKEVERVIKKMNPSIVIYDMLDNIGGYEDTGTTDQRYKQLYDHARQMADKYRHSAIGTSQASGEANGLERIEMHMLYGSRTAKQGTADLMIMIGRSLEAHKYNTRYIYTPKNKLQSRKAPPQDPKTNCEVQFRGDIKRFLDPVNVEE